GADDHGSAVLTTGRHPAAVRAHRAGSRAARLPARWADVRPRRRGGQADLRDLVDFVDFFDPPCPDALPPSLLPPRRERAELIGVGSTGSPSSSPVAVDSPRAARARSTEARRAAMRSTAGATSSGAAGAATS